MIWLALAALLLVGGCAEARFASGVTAHALERHELPPLDRIDGVEVAGWKRTFIPPRLYDARIGGEPESRMVTSRITDPAEVAALVSLVDGNRWWENPPLDLAPRIYPEKPDVSPVLVFLSGAAPVREVRVKGRLLITRIGARTVQREISVGEAERVARLIEGARQ